jgi:phenylalanyl-tRNA synthetase alpha chain
LKATAYIILVYVYTVYMHKYEVAVLNALRKKHSLSFGELASASGLGPDEVMWAIENLLTQGYIETEKEQSHEVSFSTEGKRYAAEALPEERLLKELKKKDLKPSELSKEESIGMQWCMKLGLAEISKGVLHITANGKAQGLPTSGGIALKQLSENLDSYSSLVKTHKSMIDSLVKRGIISVKEKSRIKEVSITQKGLKAEVAAERSIIDAITREVITGKTWQAEGFKKYDVNIPVENQIAATRHPIRRTINEVKNTFLSMGFNEISGPIVEPSFWVFDSLFVPQDHPAREAQDTFHLSNPEFIEVEGDDYVKSIRKAHTKSWKSEWKQEETERAILRTHTTSVSVHYISEFVKKVFEGESYPTLPIKLFSVGRVFRNENIDYKHLADFYMVDGIMIGKDLTMANLFDTLITFYKSMGFKVRFKPSYFPFVEPGAEVYAYYERTKEWVEMGGSGIIRSEVTSLPRKNITVLAWGLGIERMLLLKDSSIGSINELYNSDIGWLRSRKV